MSILSQEISVIVPCYYSVDAVKNLLTTIPKKHEVILVDNSRDEALKEIANIYDCKLLVNKENLGCPTAWNIGAKNATKNFFLFSNPDTLFLPNTVEELFKAVIRYPNASAFNPKIIDRKNNQHFKRRSVLMPKSEWMSRKYPKADSEVSVLQGSAIFIKKENFNKLKGFDEDIFLYHDDDDLSIRLKKEIGPLMYINNSEIVHLSGSSSSRNKEIASIKGYHMGRSRVCMQGKHKIAGYKTKNIIFAIFQLLSLEMLLSPRKRTKYLYFAKGVFEEIFFKNKK
tara:strand:- start:3536 stop:4387 length:852 start_codon:yes stop_codon:yes gene_type:complete